MVKGEIIYKGKKKPKINSFEPNEIIKNYHFWYVVFLWKSYTFLFLYDLKFVYLNQRFVHSTYNIYFRISHEKNSIYPHNLHGIYPFGAFWATSFSFRYGENTLFPINREYSFGSLGNGCFQKSRFFTSKKPPKYFPACMVGHNIDNCHFWTWFPK